MDIRLERITKENYEAVCDLSVTEDQMSYVADNTWSLVESMFNPHYQTRAIVHGEEPVGFFMWVPKRDTNLDKYQEKISIWRFMVDKKFQQNGIGRQALYLALEEIRCSGQARQIEICYDPENPLAKTFYASFGFVEVGLDEDQEDMLAVIDLL